MDNYYKLLAADLTHNGYRYREGLNIDPNFIDNVQGFNIVKEMEIGRWLHYNGLRMTYICKVTFPMDAIVFVNNFNTKTTNKMILSKKQTVDDFFTHHIQGHEILLQGIKAGVSLLDVKQILQSFPLTKEMYQVSVYENWASLQHVPYDYLDDAIIFSAVKSNYTALRFVPESFLTSLILEFAVNKNYRALNLIPSHLLTPKIMSLAKKHKDYDGFFVGINDEKKSLGKNPVFVRTQSRFMNLDNIFDEDL